MPGEQYIPISHIEQRLTEIESQIARLDTEREILRDLRRRAVAGDRPKVDRPQVPDVLEPKQTPTNAILAYVREHPGAAGKEVVAAVINRVESSAKDPKRMLYTLVGDLVKREKLVKNAEGGLLINT